MEEFPKCILKMTLGMLPASYGFVAPVSRKFRDLYNEVIQEKKKNRTYRYSISSEAALQKILNEGQFYGSHEQRTSYIGAGCGRIEWVERGGVFDRMTCIVAAAGGQLGVLKWLRERGCPWDQNTCHQTASKGHLEVLQWLREEGCPWDEWTCRAAAKGGHLEVLQWLREEGCPWDEYTCAGAARGGHLELLRWALENGCPYNQWDTEVVTDPDFHEWHERFERERRPME